MNPKSATMSQSVSGTERSRLILHDYPSTALDNLKQSSAAEK